jgi:adenine specific DNA methylase Mod
MKSKTSKKKNKANRKMFSINVASERLSFTDLSMFSNHTEKAPHWFLSFVTDKANYIKLETIKKFTISTPCPFDWEEGEKQKFKSAAMNYLNVKSNPNKFFIFDYCEEKECDEKFESLFQPCECCNGMKQVKFLG